MTAATYEIKVKGHLDEEWSEWLGALRITYDNEGNTLLSGQVADQAALHGILGQIRDLGLTLISIVPENSPPGSFDRPVDALPPRIIRQDQR